MFKRIAMTISAAALAMLAIALAPAVPTALATAHRTTTIKDDATLKQPLANQPCAAFEALANEASSQRLIGTSQIV
jgi:hypothetical protein